MRGDPLSGVPRQALQRGGAEKGFIRSARSWKSIRLALVLAFHRKKLSRRQHFVLGSSVSFDPLPEIAEV
jgi:hypothetical protein